ncbi:MAG: quinoprotein dehydrogenase-associated SoxYZ-like carrier [Gammaproteobacteria bacterium]|nr:quinoprotein dehydrogenase-associated SoxYZ-like carrier [Gammaproteobacteria bacterium]
MIQQSQRYLLHGTLLMLAAVFGLAGPSAADVAPPDWRESASDKIWDEQLRPAAFADRAILEGTGQNVLELKAPFRAEDATVVPVSISTHTPQTDQSYIRRIHVYIDKNPLPLVGIFEFTPRSGRADLAIRVRVDDFSYVRAIAEMNTGELYMAKSFVRATGACSAPPPKSIDDSIANMGTMKIDTVGEVDLSKPALLQLRIKHPNITGLQPMKIGSHVRPPAHFISELNVTYAGEPIMKATLTFSISMDPSFRFFFVPSSEGTITVEAIDTEQNRWTASQDIRAS